jgi:hypothetical protein
VLGTLPDKAERETKTMPAKSRDPFPGES